MGGRYWISGVQLGMLVAGKTEADRKELVDMIIDLQYIGKKKDLKKYVEKRC
jgi:hypothetical protein